MTLTNHLWVILEYDFYAPAYFFLKYKACQYFKIPMSLHTKEILRPGKSDCFKEVFYFVHNLQNSMWFQNLNFAALVVSPSVSCSCLLPKNVSWEGFKESCWEDQNLQEPFCSTLATDKLTCDIKQHLSHPCPHSDIISVENHVILVAAQKMTRFQNLHLCSRQSSTESSSSIYESLIQCTWYH